MKAPILRRDEHPFLTDVLDGLSRPVKTIPPKYLYDATGSELFEKICSTKEYYLTRVELSVLTANLADIITSISATTTLVEPGSGASTKTRLLLQNLPRLRRYEPIDVSADFLDLVSRDLRSLFPWVEIVPYVGDFTHNMPAASSLPSEVTVCFFPGSTIGNFSKLEAVDVLKTIRKRIGPGGSLLVGYDLKKNEDVLVRAYNDAEGLTEQFIANVLTRINRELGGTFDRGQFTYQAIYSQGRIEMHLVSKQKQTVRIAGCSVNFSLGESILVECSAKYTLSEFAVIANQAGLAVTKTWLDESCWFALSLLCPVAG